jgi:hypothetical protein
VPRKAKGRNLSAPALDFLDASRAAGTLKHDKYVVTYLRDVVIRVQSKLCQEVTPVLPHQCSRFLDRRIVATE